MRFLVCCSGPFNNFLMKAIFTQPTAPGAAPSGRATLPNPMEARIQWRQPEKWGAGEGEEEEVVVVRKKDNKKQVRK